MLLGGGEGSKSEVRSQRSEVGGQRSEVGVGGRRSGFELGRICGLRSDTKWISVGHVQLLTDFGTHITFGERKLIS